MTNALKTMLYIWGSRVVYIGRLDDVDWHRYASTALLIALEDEMTLSWEGPDAPGIPCRSAIIPADLSHQMKVGEQLLAVYFLPSELDPYLRARYPAMEQQKIHLGLEQQQAWIDLSLKVYEQVPEPETFYQWIDQQLQPMLAPIGLVKSMDERIVKVLTLLREDESGYESMETLAAHVKLSATRLSHLFREQTGMTLTRYRSFTRMRSLAVMMGEGKSMTEAALEAGFTDSSHFSRMFRDMYGIPPSKVFHRRGEVIIKAGEG